jgi:hypothetical protein
MRFFRVVLIAVFFSAFSFSAIAQGQIKSFTEDPVKFLEELETFLISGSSSNNKKEIKDFLEQFTLIWNTKLNEKHKSAAYKTCNAMLKKKVRPLPDFKNYLTSLMNFVSTNQPESSFAAWQESLDKILSGKGLKIFSDYLEMSETLFASNTFYKTNSHSWSASNGNYRFEYDSVPKVVFPIINLICLNNHNDSAVIYNTKGTYYPATGKWVGQGGKVTWEKTGLDKNTVYGELKRYETVVKSGLITADSVNFYNKLYFSTPLLGKLTDKAVTEKEGSEAYPSFESYNKRLQIKNIAENVDYDGGFTMRGAKLFGAGDKNADAYITFKRNDKVILKAASKIFILTKEKVVSESAAITIRLDKDSIYHPYLTLRFNIKDKKLSLIRSQDGISRTPFFNSYHVLDMYFEELTWKLDEPKMEMGVLAGTALSETDFESSSYYKQNRYDKLQGMDAVHPLVQIKDYLRKLNGITRDDAGKPYTVREFSNKDLASYMRVTTEQLNPFLVHLATMGFIIFDTGSGQITVKDRLFQYITNRAGFTDYDVINFHSVNPGQTNATLNLLNHDLTIKGVNKILLSDSQAVVLEPKPNEIVLKKNRDFKFAGIIHAGRFDFYGKEFSFEYDKFKVNLTNVDSVRLKVQSFTADDYGNYPLVRVKTVIEDLNGELLIDHPQNKSGVKNFAKYPEFKSFKESFVYYDKRSIQRGAYKRDKFYFKLEPFTIDSLDNFSNAGLNFKGEFVSAGVFPQFKESLTLQRDYSLGFIRNAPPEGFALYGNKAKFNNQIMLSNEGLKGDGTIEYVTSVSKSNEFIFFPDSMNANVQEWDMKEQKAKPEFPQLKLENGYVHWMPKKDLMQVYSRQTAFVGYNGQAEFKGRVNLTPKESAGNGVMSFAGSELESKTIKFRQNKFNADTAAFRLKALDLAGLAFSTDNVNAEIDFDKRLGDFKSNGPGTVMRFPVNQYICFMDRFKWFMDDSSIELSSDQKTTAGAGTAEQTGMDLEGPEFISVHPKQDSLRFIAPRAKYDLKKNIIFAKEVKFIDVADARITPDKGDVVIEKNALMQTLQNATILANTTTKYHSLYNGMVNIFARRSYAASADFDYVDELKTRQKIHFSNISVDTTYQTYAVGDIADSAKFMLSPNFEYRGKAKLFASNQFLTFEGATRIQHNCEAVNTQWFRFTTEVNPLQILIPVTADPRDIKNGDLSASIMITQDSTHLYSAFLSRKNAKSDQEILAAEGFLFFDKSSREYRISNKEKLVERNLPGNYLSLNTNNCVMYGEGKLKLSTTLGQVKMETAGNATHFLVPDSTAFDLVLAVDFFFDDNASEKMADKITAFEGLTPTDVTRQTYEKALREMLGKEKADKLISELGTFGKFRKFPDELKKQFVFNDVKMRWNTKTKSFISVGKIGIANINKTQINKFVDGKIQLVKKRGASDQLFIYLELDANTWYFFQYQNNLLMALSSDEAFNTVIKELKDDKKEMKTEKGEQPFKFAIATPAAKTKFLKDIKRAETSEKEE